MSLLIIDREKCRRDGLCAAVCPAQIIEKPDKDLPPAPISQAEEICIGCGHCVAVCPHGALSHSRMKTEDCPPIRTELRIGPEQAEQFLRARRSVRNYQNKIVPRETLTRLIKLAGFAPSGHNSQPAQWLVIEDSTKVNHLAGLVIDFMRRLIQIQAPAAVEFHMDRLVAAWEAGQDRICRGAPHLIVAHAPVADTRAQTSVIIALTYLELAAFSLGLGACWAGYLNAAAANYPPIIQALGLPEGSQYIGAMMVGYPKYKYQRLPLRNEPKIMWR